MKQELDVIIKIALVATVVCNSGCNDPLPTYEEPKVIIATIIPQATLDTVFYAESFEEVGPDSNLVFQQPNPVVFNFFAENLYVETLYGTASISGKLEISVIDRPDLGATIPIKENNIVPEPAYDPRTQILTLDPNGTVRFQVEWNLRDNNGRMIYHDLENFSTTSASGWSFYRIFSTRIHVRVLLQLYPQTSTFEGDQDFDLNIKGGIRILGP